MQVKLETDLQIQSQVQFKVHEKILKSGALTGNFKFECKVVNPRDLPLRMNFTRLCTVELVI
jgi:hypothetical protein